MRVIEEVAAFMITTGTLASFAEAYFTKSFKAAGGEIVGNARTPQQETNFSAYMERVLQAKPDALYMFQPAGSPSVAFVKGYVERGLKAAGIKLLGGGETQELFLPNFTDEIVGTVTSFHYTESNQNPANLELRAQLKKMFGDKAVPDIATVAAWDGTMLIQRAVSALGPDADGLKYIDFIKAQKFDSPRGPVQIDPAERDVVQNIYIREVEKRDGKLVNVDIGEVTQVKGSLEDRQPAEDQLANPRPLASVRAQRFPAATRAGHCYPFALTILLDGISYGMILFLISVGLTVTMGLMRIVNLAHGSVHRRPRIVTVCDGAGRHLGFLTWNMALRRSKSGPVPKQRVAINRSQPPPLHRRSRCCGSCARRLQATSWP
jgi:hypothetical protein